MDEQRRLLVNAGALALLFAGGARTARAETVSAPPVPPGNPGDFDFLTGEWRIHHRWRAGPSAEWIEFDGEASVYRILNGIGSVEELRIPARNFSGMGLRLLDVANRVWSDFWVNAQSGVLTTPGQTGGFVDGVGVFSGDELGAADQAQGIWDNIGVGRCRWRQRVSGDGGANWQQTWDMDWRRVD